MNQSIINCPENIEDIYVKNVYNKIANDFSITRISIWNGVKKFIDTIPSFSWIADLGCGNGKNIQRDDLYWYAIDQCDGFLDICKKRFNGKSHSPHICKGSITDIPLLSNSVDFLICIATFHHLASENNRHKSLEEFKRILKPGGKGLITVWAHEFEKGFQWEKEIKRQGGGQDILIPWRGTKKNSIKEERYYHFFKKDEIMNLVSIYFIIEDMWFETNNWFIVFRK